MPFLPPALRTGGKNRSEYLRAQTAKIYMGADAFPERGKNASVTVKAPEEASSHAKNPAGKHPDEWTTEL